MRIAIVGAGMAGLACAEALTEAGETVVLLDKGRGPGGRMSTRRTETAAGWVSFDHGAQYFTAREPAFQARLARWRSGGHVAPWREAGPDAWVGSPAMNAPVAQMAQGLAVHWSMRVDALSRTGDRWRLDGAGQAEGWDWSGEAFDAVVLAVPAEQAAPLLAPWAPGMAARAAQARSEPCWTLMAAFETPVAGAPDIIRTDGVVQWAARNSAKPDRGGPEAWVVQAAPAWSSAHIDDSADHVREALLATFAALVGGSTPSVLTATAHRWRYARAARPGAAAAALWNADCRLGACGDWLMGPRVECAWLSGTAAGAAVRSAPP